MVPLIGYVTLAKRFLMAPLNFSQRPFDAAWWNEKNLCLIHSIAETLAVNFEANYGPFSDKIVSGKANLAKEVINVSHTSWEVIEAIAIALV